MRSLTMLAVLFFAAAVQGQVMYQPLQVQYGQTQNSFYYGGTDPHLFAFAQSPRSATYGRIHGAALVAARRVVVQQDQPRVFSDLFPGYEAGTFGYTTADAINDARADVRRYTHKGQLLAESGVRQGGVVTISIRQKLAGTPEIAPRPVRAVRPILIINTTPRTADKMVLAD